MPHRSDCLATPRSSCSPSIPQPDRNTRTGSLSFSNPHEKTQQRIDKFDRQAFCKLDLTCRTMPQPGGLKSKIKNLRYRWADGFLYARQRHLTHFQSVVESAIGAVGASAFAEHEAGSLWELTGSLTPQSPGGRCRISGQPFTVGRDCDNALQLANPTISRRHAELLLIEKDLYVRDISSRNGTFLNGRRVGNFEKLNSGDMLQFGTAVFTVRSPAHNWPNSPSNHHRKAQFESDLEDFAAQKFAVRHAAGRTGVDPVLSADRELGGGGPPLGFRVLARSRLVGLETPGSMFRVAGERGLEVDLNEVARRRGLRIARWGLTGELYLNTHPSELQQDRLSDSLRRLRNEFPDAPIVIEIHESAVTSLKMLSGLRGQLRELDKRLAYDGPGARTVAADGIGRRSSRRHQIRHVPDPRRLQQLGRAAKYDPVAGHDGEDLAVVPLAEGVEPRRSHFACADWVSKWRKDSFSDDRPRRRIVPLGRMSDHPSI